jgi:hypothetical protein
MANTIVLKRSGTNTSAPSSLTYGEIAINYNDGRLFYKDSADNIVAAKLITNISGTNDEISVSESSGSFTISLPSSVYISSLFVNNIEIDTTGATPDYALIFDGTKFAPAPAPTGPTGPDRLSVSDTAPLSPNEGDLWFNSSNGRLFSYYDSNWIEISGPIGATGPTGPTGPDPLTVSDTAPISPVSGDLWFNSSEAKLYSYLDSYWVEISGEAGPTGPTGPNPLTAADSAPSSPSSGDLWFNSSQAKLYAYLDSYWVEISGEAGPTGPTGPVQLADVSSTQPSNPLTGQLWYNTSTSQLNVYDGSSWNAV